MDVTTIAPGSAGETANAYLVRGDQAALVDVGASPHIVEAVQEHTSMLNTLVLTHRHAEHAEMLEQVCEAFDVDVYANDPPRGVHPALRHTLDDGARHRIGGESCTVLHTPSHAPDHIVVIGETAMFSGDLVLPPAYDVEADRYDLRHDAPDRRLGDLERVLEHMPRGLEAIYAGHGDPIEDDPHGVVESAIERVEEQVES